MASTIAALSTELQERFGNRGTMGGSPTITSARFTLAIKAAIKRTASPRVHRHAELEALETITTIVGVDSYAFLPVWGIYAMRCTSAGNIRRLMPMGFQVMEQIEKTQGPPLNYARYGRTIYLEPIPDKVYNIRVSAYHYPDVSGTDCPLHEVYDEAVLCMGEAIVFERYLQDLTRGKMMREVWREELSIVSSPDEMDKDDNQDTFQPDEDWMRPA